MNIFQLATKLKVIHLLREMGPGLWEGQGEGVIVTLTVVDVKINGPRIPCSCLKVMRKDNLREFIGYADGKLYEWRENKEVEWLSNATPIRDNMSLIGRYIFHPQVHKKQGTWLR